MNGKIQEPTLERMEEIRGKPLRRGLDKAINECLDLLENKTVTCDDEGQITKVEDTEQADCLNDNCKEELKENAS